MNLRGTEHDWSPDRIHIARLYVRLGRCYAVDTNKNTNTYLNVGVTDGSSAIRSGCRAAGRKNLWRFGDKHSFRLVGLVGRGRDYLQVCLQNIQFLGDKSGASQSDVQWHRDCAISISSIWDAARKGIRRAAAHSPHVEFGKCAKLPHAAGKPLQYKGGKAIRGRCRGTRKSIIAYGSRALL